jgi:hypothetical protein
MASSTARAAASARPPAVLEPVPWPVTSVRASRSTTSHVHAVTPAGGTEPDELQPRRSSGPGRRPDPSCVGAVRGASGRPLPWPASGSAGDRRPCRPMGAAVARSVSAGPDLGHADDPAVHVDPEAGAQRRLHVPDHLLGVQLARRQDVDLHDPPARFSSPHGPTDTRQRGQEGFGVGRRRAGFLVEACGLGCRSCSSLARPDGGCNRALTGTPGTPTLPGASGSGSTLEGTVAA